MTLKSFSIQEAVSHQLARFEMYTDALKLRHEAVTHIADFKDSYQDFVEGDVERDISIQYES